MPVGIDTFLSGGTCSMRVFSSFLSSGNIFYDDLFQSISCFTLSIYITSGTAVFHTSIHIRSGTGKTKSRTCLVQERTKRPKEVPYKTSKPVMYWRADTRCWLWLENGKNTPITSGGVKEALERASSALTCAVLDHRYLPEKWRAGQFSWPFLPCSTA